MSDLVGADDVTAWNLSREKKDEIIFHRTLFPLDFLKLKQGNKTKQQQQQRASTTTKITTTT